MPHPADLDVIDLSDDPWVLYGTEMAKLWRASGLPPDPTVVESAARLARLRAELEAGPT